MKIAVVILNWNGISLFKDFLPSVMNYSSGAEIIVADNSSTDGSVDFILENFPQVRVIRLPKNYGFAKGYNEALKQVEADIYVILNSDVEVTEGWLDKPVKLMSSDDKIAACQPKILSYCDRNKFEYAGAAGGFIDKFGYPFCRGRVFQALEYDTMQYNDNIDIFWASGAAFFIKASLFHELGGFDEDFFAHMEEIDLCWRLKMKGFRIVFCGESVVYHLGGGTLKKGSWRKTYLNMRNNLEMLYKNLPEEKLYRTMFYRLFLDIAASLKFLVDGGFKDFYAVFRAHGHFYRNWRRIYKKRSKKCVPVSEIYQSNVAFDYFLKGIKLYPELLKRGNFTK